MNLRTLSNQVLLDQTFQLARRERMMTLEILHHLREIERRKLFAELGYPSLFEYCVKQLGYSAASAQRRLCSMRLLKEIPELEEKVQEGKLSLSTLAAAQVYFKKESKCQYFKTDQKKKIVENLIGKSARAAERELLSISKSPELHLKEKVKVVTPAKFELTFFADDELMEILEKIRGFLSHKFETLTEVITHIAKDYWNKSDPSRRSINVRVLQSVPTSEVHSDTIPAAIKRAVWKRDNGRCAYINKYGQRCISTYRLQFDHYPIPKAKGGTSTEENLRLACYQHNVLHAIKSYGLKKMEKYWVSKTIT